ncbi:hypothetical protein PUN28_001214 [Cardiocondyla obscurior]|uniref:Uncharacterized protein n=1 Tax=Cardiocondyla obscurior TaxID=286306 RepID=A0AAW2H3Z0_9HYME
MRDKKIDFIGWRCCSPVRSKYFSIKKNIKKYYPPTLYNAHRYRSVGRSSSRVPNRVMRGTRRRLPCTSASLVYENHRTYIRAIGLAWINRNYLNGFNVVNVVNPEAARMAMRQSAQSLHMHGRHLHDVYVNRAMRQNILNTGLNRCRMRRACARHLFHAVVENKIKKIAPPPVSILSLRRSFQSRFIGARIVCKNHVGRRTRNRKRTRTPSSPSPIQFDSVDDDKLNFLSKIQKLKLFILLRAGDIVREISRYRCESFDLHLSWIYEPRVSPVFLPSRKDPLLPVRAAFCEIRRRCHCRQCSIYLKTEKKRNRERENLHRYVIEIYI